MQFLNGMKTWIGLAGTVLTVALPRLAPVITDAAPHAISIAQGVFGLLLALGLIHKREKAKATP